MQERKLSRMVRIAVLPVAAIGLSMPVLATGDSATTASSNSATTTSRAQAPQKQRDLRASEVIGMSVRNEKGDNIGQIGDMVVNMNSGQVRYAILEFDPGIFEGEEKFAVPTSELHMAPDRDDVVFDISEERLEKAAVKSDDWDDGVLDRQVLEGLDKLWAVTPPTGDAHAYRMSELIGMDVKNRKGDEVGEVQELVVNMAGQKVHYAVLSYDPGAAADEKDYAVPLTAFNLTDDREKLVLDVDQAKLKDMKPFNEDRYAHLNDPVWLTDIDRYFVAVFPVVMTSGTSSASTSTASSGSNAQDDKSTFAQLDQDGNGTIERAEATDGKIDQWATLDQDDNGKISREEFKSMHASPSR